MKLYTYFRSSAAYRVRIALNLKGLSYESVPVHLLRDGGQQRLPAYRAFNPAGLIPALVAGDGRVLTQSLAIIEYLEETHPEPPLLPSAAIDRARVRALAQTIAIDTHPLNNLRILQYLGRTLGVDEAARQAWYRHWTAEGLGAFEQLLAADPKAGDFCHGDTPGLADCCLVPQVFNARRFGCDLSAMPRVCRIVDNCERLPAFQQAAPGQQPDAE